MRIVLSLAALLLATAAAPAPQVNSQSEASPRFQPRPLDGLQVTAPGDKGLCGDRIHTVREERGLPRLQRETVSPDEPLFILAVDTRIDGCSVMVMAHNPNDIRPVPTAPGRGELIPAR